MPNSEGKSGLPGLSNSYLLASIVESSDDAIYSKTLDGTIVSWNRAAEKIFGYRPEEIIGQNVRLLIPEDRQPEEETILQRVGRGEKVARLVTERVTKEGQILQVSVTVSPVRDGGRKVVGASAIVRELDTDEHRMQELRSIALASAARASRVDALATTLRQQTKALETVGKALKTFVPSDELTTRLRNVERRLLAVIVLAVFLAASLVGGFVEYSRLDGCHRRNDSNQVIRDIVDRSTNQGANYDQTKLSPDTNRILAEVGAATKSGNGAAFRDYVYARTKHQTCSLIP